MTIETIAYIYATENQLLRIKESDVEINETLTSNINSNELKITATASNIFLLRRLRVINRGESKRIVDKNVEVIHVYD